jgi:hypothetical protein
LARKVSEAKTAEDRHELIAGLKVAELKALAGALGMKGAQPNKKAWQDQILNFTVQNKLNSQAIRDQMRRRVAPTSREGRGDAAMKRNMDVLSRGTPAEERAGQSTGPTYLDTPRTIEGNGGFGPGSFHPDGRMGGVWQGLRGQQGAENIGGQRLDDALAETIRMGYDGQPGRIGQQMDRFREIISQVKDPKVKHDLEYAMSRLQPQSAQGMLSEKEIADAPAPLLKLLAHLETIPDTGQGGGEAAKLVDLLRRWSAGKMRAGMLDIEVARLGGWRHESQEGYHEMKRAVGEAERAIRELRRSLKMPGSEG